MMMLVYVCVFAVIGACTAPIIQREVEKHLEPDSSLWNRFCGWLVMLPLGVAALILSCYLAYQLDVYIDNNFLKQNFDKVTLTSPISFTGIGLSLLTIGILITGVAVKIYRLREEKQSSRGFECGIQCAAATLSIYTTTHFTDWRGFLLVSLISIAILWSQYVDDWWNKTGREQFGVGLTYIIAWMLSFLMAMSFGLADLSSPTIATGAYAAIFAFHGWLIWRNGMSTCTLPFNERPGYKALKKYSTFMMIATAAIMLAHFTGHIGRVESMAIKTFNESARNYNNLIQYAASIGMSKNATEIKAALAKADKGDFKTLIADTEKAKVNMLELKASIAKVKLAVKQRESIVWPSAFEGTWLMTCEAYEWVKKTYTSLGVTNGAFASTPPPNDVVPIDTAGVKELMIDDAQANTNKFSIRGDMYYRFEEVIGDFKAVYPNGEEIIVREKYSAGERLPQIPKINTFKIVPLNGKTWIKLRASSKLEDFPRA